VDAPGSSRVWVEKDDGVFVPLAGNCTFGRSRTNTILLTSEKVSRHHAAIHVQDGGEFWLIDLGSINGTLLNDRRVVRPSRLEDGDRISIADQSFVFRKPGASEDRTSGETLPTIPDLRFEDRWLMLADIEGFTPLSQQIEARHLATLLGTWVRRGREIVERHGGTMNKYLGDGYLACWPAREDTPAQIAETVRAFQALAAEAEPKFRLIVHRGTISIGGSAAASFGEKSLMGPEMNFTFRVEKIAAQCGVAFCFTDPAREALGGLLPIEPIPGDHELKGFPGSHRFFRL
jgi:adenylate cyclase